MTYRLSIFVFAGLAWALWNSRNKMAIEKRFPSNPVDITQSGIMFKQKWSPLLKDSDREKMNKVLNRMKAFVDNYKLSDVVATDIAFI
jgi:hypothetical protein